MPVSAAAAAVASPTFASMAQGGLTDAMRTADIGATTVTITTRTTTRWRERMRVSD